MSWVRDAAKALFTLLAVINANSSLSGCSIKSVKGFGIGQGATFTSNDGSISWFCVRISGSIRLFVWR